MNSQRPATFNNRQIRPAKAMTLFDKENKRITKRGRKYLHGIALAFLPIITAAGIMTENMAALWATLLGAILVPWVALEDSHRAERESRDSYARGLDEGYGAATGNDEGETWQH